MEMFGLCLCDTGFGCSRINVVAGINGMGRIFAQIK